MQNINTNYIFTFLKKFNKANKKAQLLRIKRNELTSETPHNFDNILM